MTNISNDLLHHVIGAQSQGEYVCQSNGYKGAPIIRGDQSSTLANAKQSYMDRGEASGNWPSACWLNRVCGRSY